MVGFPKFKTYEELKVNLYANLSSEKEEQILEVILKFCKQGNVLSPVSILPDVSHKAGRISPTGWVMASDSHIFPTVSPACNGSGVRVIKLDYSIEDITKEKLDTFLRFLAVNIPIYGYNSPFLLRHVIRKEDLAKIYHDGANWALENLNLDEDVSRIESHGKFTGVLEEGEELLNILPDHFVTEGLYGFGILESGNHFIELQLIDEIFDEIVAKELNISKGQLIVMIHDGNPATCATEYYTPMNNSIFKDDKIKYHSKNMIEKMYKNHYYKIERHSEEGNRYMSLMGCACNYGFVNRIAITKAVLESLKQSLKVSNMGYQLITDTMHDCIKDIEINNKKLTIHRHGASEARTKDCFENDELFSRTGQLIGIPGAPGTLSYLCSAQEGAKDTFYTVNHGAGRKLDRNEARESFTDESTTATILNSGASFLKAGLSKLSGENPKAFKDINEIINISENTNLLKRVASLKPLAIYKG